MVYHHLPGKSTVATATRQAQPCNGTPRQALNGGPLFPRDRGPSIDCLENIKKNLWKISIFNGNIMGIS